MVRQNTPMRMKPERTDAGVSSGCQADSFCCLNALLSGHLEGGCCASSLLLLVMMSSLERGKSIWAGELNF